MTLDRTVVLDSREQLDIAVGLLTSNWRPMRDAGHTLAVRVYEHKDRRTLEQQSLMWIRLGELADQVWIGGRQFAAVVWHEELKAHFLPNEEGPTKRCRKGYRKWDMTPSGSRVLVGSTTGLTTAGMSEYMEQIMAYGASEFGVKFSATPREMR